MSKTTKTRKVMTTKTGKEVLQKGFIFNTGDSSDSWLMMLTYDHKVLFNTERYPKALANDFARAIADVLANTPMVKERFEKAFTEEIIEQ